MKVSKARFTICNRKGVFYNNNIFTFRTIPLKQILYSSRSKVKGHLEIYLAYVREEGEVEDEEEEANTTTRVSQSEEDWELITDGSSSPQPPQSSSSGTSTAQMNNVRIYSTWKFPRPLFIFQQDILNS